MNANGQVGSGIASKPKRKPRTRLMWVPTLARDGSERIVSYLEEQTWPFRKALLHTPFIAVRYFPAGESLCGHEREAFRLAWLAKDLAGRANETELLENPS